jgi:pimeloyl-ACP methyl ester carboxylesterase
MLLYSEVRIELPSLEILMNMRTRITGEGKPVVLVPGGLTGWLSWEPHAARLSSSRKVILVQLLNVQYGFENRPLPSGYSVKTESRALAGALTQTKLDYPLDIVAWSYGALSTLDYALDHPDRIRSLVLIEPPANWVLHALGKVDSDLLQNEKILSTLHGNITEEMLTQFLFAVGLCPPGQNPRELPQWSLWVQYRRSLRNSPAVIKHTDKISRLNGFNKPVLLVKGTGSAGFLHQIIEVLSKELPQASVVEMPAGHAPQIVSMDRFLAEMTRFQNSIDSLSDGYLIPKT